MTHAFRDHRTFGTRQASWFVSILVVVTLISTGLKLVVAQPQGGDSGQTRDTSDATFDLTINNIIINTKNIAYVSDDGGQFDIYFACSSTRGSDPLRLTNSNDINQARFYFNNKRQGSHFEQYSKYNINVNQIAYIESKDNSLNVCFSARISDTFVQLTLSGADAEHFRKKRREL